MGYENQYVREVLDTYTHKTEKRFGFRTTSVTRPAIISRLVEIVRDHTDLINDRDTLEELLTITRNEKGKVEAPEGSHDDMMMALAIAHQIRDQVIFDERAIRSDPVFRFNVEKTASSLSAGREKRVVI